MKKINVLKICSAIFGLVLISSCTKGDPYDTTVPSYIEVSAFKVENTPDNSVSNFEGCFTSNINTVEITVKNSVENKLIGVFELPCRVPILREGKFDVVLKPSIKLNGISATRNFYPFYNEVVVKDVNFVPDSTVVVDTQTVYYNTTHTRFVWQQYFEQFVTNPFTPDSIVKITKDTVRSDNSSGVIYIRPDQKELAFVTRDSCIVTNNGALFLEMDYWTNVPFEIGLKAKNTSGGVESTYYGISLYPNKGWEKIYIQLGRLWSNTFNYYHTFKVAFRVSNSEGIEGKTYIDNLKLVAYK